MFSLYYVLDSGRYLVSGSQAKARQRFFIWYALLVKPSQLVIPGTYNKKRYSNTQAKLDILYNYKKFQIKLLPGG